MKKLIKLAACAWMSAGVFTSAFAQIQTAGTLLVDVDATGQPAGVFTYLTNNGTLGGVFLANNSAVAGVSNLVVALGGNGTHGVLLDGNQNSLRHFTSVTGTNYWLTTAAPGLIGSSPVFSVESWIYKATINDDGGPVAWGNRIVSGANVGCNYGRNTGWGGFSWQGTGYDHGWNSVPASGVWHHLTWTYDAVATGTGVGTLRLYRDGVLDKAEVQTNAPNISGTNNIWMGVEHSGTGTAVFSAEVVGKVRIHSGVLTASQIINNYNYETANFTNGTPATFLTTAPIHRFSFNQPPTNNAIGLTVPDTGSSPAGNAIIRGTTLAAAAIPYYDGGQLVLPSFNPSVGNNGTYTNAYVDMPNNMLSVLSVSNGGPGTVSLELWVEPTVASTWAELLFMGSSTGGEITGTGISGGGAAGIVIPGQINTSAEQSGFRSASIGNYTIGARLIGSRRHIVVTWDEASNVSKVYLEGVVVGQFVLTGKMNSINDVNSWLGRSGWNDPATPANYREFRMYNRILSPAEIRRNYVLGPIDVSDTNTLVWNGNVDTNWDIAGTANWLVGAGSTTFANANNVQLDDTATGATTVNLTTTLAPKNVNVLNSAKSYTITGSGNLTGTASLTKNGNGTLILAGPQTNDYIGPTTLSGGTVIVTNLQNGGLPSAIGAAGAGMTNLVFNGGALSYQGPSTTINRSFLVTAPNSTLNVLNTLTLSGRTLASASGVNGGTFIKTGVGTLSYTTVGSNSLSGGPLPGYQVAGGTVVFDGTAGGQTNFNVSEFWVGSAASGANLIVSNAVLSSSSWLSIGRGNGSIGNLSTLTLTNGVVNVTANGLSLGFDGGLAGNLATQVATLNGASILNCAGNMNIGESAGSSGTLYINNNSWVKCATPRTGLNAGSTGMVVIASSGALTNTAFTSIGASGVGRVVIKDNGIWNSTGDYNISDVANSQGELDISNNATIYCNGNMWLGKSAGTVGTVNQGGGNFLKTGGGDFLIGGLAGATTSVGTWNMSGGYLFVNGNFQPGTYGTGTFNQSGGSVVANSWISIGRYAGGTGYYNISSGSVADTNNTTDIIVGEGGTGTLNISGSGLVVPTNNVRIGNLTGANGTVNLNGGILVAKQIWMPSPGASSTFNFNGGILRAAAGASNNFMSGLSIAYVLAGGAVVDSGVNAIAIGQDLNTDGTGGGLTKQGSGSLTLSGNLFYTGPTLVANGTLNLTTHNYGGGSISVADGTSLGVQVLDNNGSSLAASSLTIGAATGAATTFSLGSFGNPTIAPLDVSAGTVTLNGTVTINIDPTSGLSVGEMPLISYGSLTGSSTLALGTLPPGVFGYLTNDTSSSPSFIGLVVTSVFQPRWEGLAGGNWDVQVTTNWIDAISGLPQYFYQGTLAIFDDEALGTTNVKLVTTVSPGGVLASNSVLNYAISGSGRITGSGSLTKVGTGSLTLSTTNNNYTGQTYIDGGGTLASTVANNLGTNSALIIGAGTLSLGANSQKFSTVALTNGAIAASGATITAGSYALDNGSVSALLAGGSLTTIGTNTDIVSVIGGNTYTGRTYLAGSTLAVTNLSTGGSPSGVGASSASPTNLVFAGGGLSYTGPATTTDRGYNVESGGSLSASGNITLGGPITATAGVFTKSGNAAVAYTALGTNILTRGGGAGAYTVNAGTVILNGGAGTPGSYLQTNIITGELWVGSDQVNSGAVIVTNSSLAISSWLAIDRGNGTFGSQSVVNFYDSLVTVGNCSMGFDNGIAGNSESPVLNLNGASRLTDAGALYVGESIGSSAKVSINNSSAVQVTGSAIIGRNAGAAGSLLVTNSGSLVCNGGSGWFSVGGTGTGTATFAGTALILNSRDENVGDVTGSSGTLNIQDNVTNTTANLYVGKSGTSVGVVNQSGGYLGRLNPAPLATYIDWRIGGSTAADAAAVGTYNLSGGFFEPFSNFQVGAYGTGFWNQSGGTANCANFPSMGRYPGSTGTLNVSGGVFNQTGSGQLLIIGEQGTASLTVTNNGLVNCVGGLSIGHTTTGVGVVNLGGGKLITRIVQSPGFVAVGGSGILNLNGGVLQANANNTTFMVNITAANVLAGGALIDTDTNAITIGQPLLDGGTGGGLTKFGPGSLILSGVNTYAGLTTVSNGTLRINGSIPGSVDAKAGSTIGGTGTIGGSTTVETGATLSPGASVGTLTVSGNLTIAGNLFIEVNKSLSPSNDLTVVTGSLNNTGTGTLTVTNLGATALVAGDSFKLFNQPLVGGNALTIAPSPGTGMGWTNRLALDGTIGVYATIAMNPTNLTYNLSGNTLTIQWPTDHTGWILQSQTNSLSAGLGSTWTDVAGSAAGNTSVFTVDPNAPTVFYRLRSP